MGKGSDIEKNEIINFVTFKIFVVKVLASEKMALYSNSYVHDVT